MFQDSIPLRVSLVALTLATLFTASQAWALWAPESAPFFKVAQAQQAEGCRVVEEFMGRAPAFENEEMTTPAFDISGERFLVDYEATGNAPPQLGPPGVGVFLGILVVDENENLVGQARLRREEGRDTLAVNAGPGRFTIRIVSANVDYEITVRDCTGADDPAPTPDPTPDPVLPPRDGGATGQQNGNDLPKSGGPEHGPFPAMPNGECPRGFPIERDGACYRS